MNEPFKYPGDELPLFHHAIQWKKYFSQQIRPYIKGNVLEAGAGLGSTTPFMNNGSATRWILLEPDPAMSSILQQKIETKELPSNSNVVTGTIDQVHGKYDTILYIDVLEHIASDDIEMKKAAALLNPGGHIIVLAPAFQFLYSPFDKAIGHFRRYNKKMLRNITPASLQLVSNKYYDSIGYFASFMNKLVQRQKYPTSKQVMFWDKWMVPVSKVTDKLFFHSFGKSIISVWKKIN